jgi:hypothetical protein
VAFEHWRHVFAEEELIRFGSPHFDRKSAGQALSASVIRGASRLTTCNVAFDESLILAANEVFPEAAVSDPLADLEVWDEWRSGIRSFPYPGRYGRLGIRRQDAKTNSTSSTGVLGEIMAGLFAQSGIAPWILVRVIRKWPDFIMYLRGNRYAFVEAKAYSREMLGKTASILRIPDGLLGECVVDAVQQLNSDPFVQVWGAFTYIEQINPMRLQVKFLELDVGDDRRNRVATRILPDAVSNGIAERALRSAVSLLKSSDVILLRESDRDPSKGERKRIEGVVVPIAMQVLEELLVEEEVRTAVLASRQHIEAAVRRLVRKATIPEEGEGKKTFLARERATQGVLSYLRDIGNQALFVGELGRDEYSLISARWNPNWSSANKEWKKVGSTDIWRCGGALFAIGGKKLEGMSIR